MVQRALFLMYPQIAMPSALIVKATLRLHMPILVATSQAGLETMALVQKPPGKDHCRSSHATPRPARWRSTLRNNDLPVAPRRVRDISGAPDQCRAWRRRQAPLLCRCGGCRASSARGVLAALLAKGKARNWERASLSLGRRPLRGCN